MKTKWGFLKKTGKAIPCLMLKPSMNGMRLSSGVPIPPGSHVDIELDMFKLGYKKAYVLKGQVMWSDYSGKTHRYEQGVQLRHGGLDTRNWQKFILEHLRGTDRNPKLHTFSIKK